MSASDTPTARAALLQPPDAAACIALPSLSTVACDADGLGACLQLLSDGRVFFTRVGFLHARRNFRLSSREIACPSSIHYRK